MARERRNALLAARVTDDDMEEFQDIWDLLQTDMAEWLRMVAFRELRRQQSSLRDQLNAKQKADRE